jgi:cytochrome c-type biogenesis protein CcmH/NrfG
MSIKKKPLEEKMKFSLVSKIAVLGMASVFFASCSPSYNSIKRMQKMEEGVAHPNTKEELKEALSKYERRALDLVTTEAQEGIWYKMLGTRYLDEKMYGQAMESFKKALTFYPDNANLYYYIAVCAVYVAHGQAFDLANVAGTIDSEKKEEYLRMSEAAYTQALNINPDYYRALYGIGVLYTFELTEDSAKAIPYMERFLQTQTKDTNGMFVLARAYYLNAEYDKAIALYDKIIELAPSKEKVADAQNNKKIVLDAQYANN